MTKEQASRKTPKSSGGTYDETTNWYFVVPIVVFFAVAASLMLRQYIRVVDTKNVLRTPVRSMNELAHCDYHPPQELAKRPLSEVLKSESEQAGQGNVQAMFDLGLAYFNNKNYPLGIYWYNRAAAQGSSGALNNLGVAYKGGYGVKRDEWKAAELYIASATMGDPEGLSNFAAVEYSGLGIPMDQSSALKHLKQAIDKGSSSAQNLLGSIYYDKGNIQAAMPLLCSAANKGYTRALTSIGAIYAFPKNGAADYKKGLSWFRLAADRGDGQGLMQLGWAYENGQGVSADNRSAFVYYQKSALSNSIEGMLNLARAYYDGIGTNVDRDASRSWYQRAAAQGNDLAKQELSNHFPGTRDGGDSDKYHAVIDSVPSLATVAGVIYSEGKALEKDTLTSEYFSKDFLEKYNRLDDGPVREVVLTGVYSSHLQINALRIIENKIVVNVTVYYSQADGSESKDLFFYMSSDGKIDDVDTNTFVTDNPSGSLRKLPTIKSQFEIDANRTPDRGINTTNNVSAIAKYPRGMIYSLARQELLTDGWLPKQGPTQYACDSGDVRCKQFPEAQSCSGAGEAYCIFVWANKHGDRTLTIQTIGESPYIERLSIENSLPARQLTISRNSDQEFKPAVGRLGYGRCHMDECSFFKILSSKKIGSTSEGTLYEMTVSTWGSSYDRSYGEKEYDRQPKSTSRPELGTQMVFCSKTRPMTFFQSNSNWDSLELRPGDDSSIYGYNESAYQFYYAACHNYVSKTPYHKKLANQLGYAFTENQKHDADADGHVRPLDMLR